MDLDYNLMQGLVDVDIELKSLEEGYCKKYFRKDTKKPWSFRCYSCEEKVVSDNADEYWTVPVTDYNADSSVRRFCSKNCADFYFNDKRNELLEKRNQIIEDRKLLSSFYEEAEQNFKEMIAKRHK